MDGVSGERNGAVGGDAHGMEVRSGGRSFKGWDIPAAESVCSRATAETERKGKHLILQDVVRTCGVSAVKARKHSLC